MPKGHAIGKRLRLGPFYVAMRQAERRILRATLEEFNHNSKRAAEALGLSRAFFDQRSIYLGGVFPDQPIREPPGKLADARYDARADGVNVNRVTPPKKLRRFGRELKRKQPKGTTNVSVSADHDPVLGLREPSTSQEESGGTSSGVGGADPKSSGGGE